MQYATSPVKWQPHEGQKKAVKFLLDHACAGLFASPGTGKTSSVLSAFMKLKAQGVANKMLVIAPLRPMSLVWPLEIKKWVEFQGLKAVVLHGKDKERLLFEDADIFLINYEGLPWLLGATTTPSPFNAKRKTVAVDLRKIKAMGVDTLIMDELSKLKHPNTVTFKALKPALGFFSRRWGLTGSPASNGLEGLWGQMYCLDVGRSLGPYITHYRNEFFHPAPSGFGFDLNPGADELIQRRIAPLVLRLDAADYVDMPDLIHRKIMFDLPPAIRKTYNEMEKEMLAELDAGSAVAANAAAASSKCRQIVNGGVYIEDEENPTADKKWVNLHTLKVDLLADLVEELQGEPLLVAYEFRHDLDRLLQRFGKDTPYIGGGVSAKRAQEIEAAWNRGEIPLLLGHPASIGHGLNLQGAGAHVCWHSLTWNQELYEQFIGRVHRQGQKAKKVFVHHILASKTVDEAIWWSLQQKTKNQNALFEALQTLRGR